MILFLFFGRLWCPICPIATVGRLTQRLAHLGLKPPPWMKKRTGLIMAAMFRSLRDAVLVIDEGNSSRITGLGDDVDALPAELRDLSRRIDALQGVRFDARDIWLREQAEYYLVLAYTELALGQRVATAIEAAQMLVMRAAWMGDAASYRSW